MNRLTLRLPDYFAADLKPGYGWSEIAERLAAYEDTGLEPDEVERYAKAEKEGRLAVLPCKVGDMVYYRRGRDILGDTVGRIILDGIGNQVLIGAHKAFIFWDFGRNVFLTREDAEKALEGMKNDEC